MVIFFILLFTTAQSIDDISTSQRSYTYFDIVSRNLRDFHPRGVDRMDHGIDSWIASFQLPSALDAISISVNQSTRCGADLQKLIDAALDRELWALKVFDAWGKPLPSGLLNGNIFWLGSYEECVNPLYQQSNRSFLQQPIETQYCKLNSDSLATFIDTFFFFRRTSIKSK